MCIAVCKRNLQHTNLQLRNEGQELQGFSAWDSIVKPKGPPAAIHAQPYSSSSFAQCRGEIFTVEALEGDCVTS